MYQVGSPVQDVATLAGFDGGWEDSGGRPVRRKEGGWLGCSAGGAPATKKVLAF